MPEEFQMPVLETLDDALNHYGENKLLAMFNDSFKILEQNLFRSSLANFYNQFRGNALNAPPFRGVASPQTTQTEKNVEDNYIWAHKPEGWDGTITQTEAQRHQVHDCGTCSRSREEEHKVWIEKNPQPVAPTSTEEKILKNPILVLTVAMVTDDFRNSLIKVGRPTQFYAENDVVGNTDNKFMRGTGTTTENCLSGEYQTYLAPDGRVFANYTGFERWYLVTIGEKVRNITAQDNYRIVYEGGHVEQKNPALPYYLTSEAHSFLRDGRVIDAIKHMREFHGLGLKQAKDLVDLARGVAIPAVTFTDTGAAVCE